MATADRRLSLSLPHPDPFRSRTPSAGPFSISHPRGIAPLRFDRTFVSDRRRRCVDQVCVCVCVYTTVTVVTARARSLVGPEFSGRSRRRFRENQKRPSTTTRADVGPPVNVSPDNNVRPLFHRVLRESRFYRVLRESRPVFLLLISGKSLE